MRKAQSLLEYSILLVIIAAAFLTMQVYMKRGFQGRMKDASDQIGDQYDTSAFNSNVRYTYNSVTMSSMNVIHGQTYNGQNGMITYREDTASTIEKKEGASHMERAPL